MPKSKSNAVLQPNLGLYYDRARLAMNPRMLSDGKNFRVQNGKLTNLNLGWERFGSFQLNGPVTLIKGFLKRDGTEQLVFATLTDIFKYVNDTTVVFLTPQYDTGTVSRAGQAVTGSGTLWTTNNIAIGDEIHFGDANYVTYPGVWDTITAVNSETSITTSGSGTVSAGTAYTIRKKFTGDISNVWSADIFVNASPSNSDELWITNGIDSIVRWDGTTIAVEEMSASLGFTCKALTVYSNMMIFLNLTQGGTTKPTDIINSNPGEPQNVTTGLAEQFKVHGQVDPILRGEVIGDALAIYSYASEGAITLAQFVGDPLIFAFRQIGRGIGPISGRTVANFGNYHQFIGPDGMYFFDGASVKSINRHIWREVLRQQDPERVAFSYAHFDEENGDLIWVVPLTTDPFADTTGAPATAFVEHYLEDPGGNAPSPYSKRDFPFTATGYFRRQTGLLWSDLTSAWSTYNFRWNDRFFFSSFPLNVAGDADGKLYTINTSQNADGSALASFVRFGRRPTVDGRMRGLVSRVYPYVLTLSTPIEVVIRMMDAGDAEAAIIDEQSFDQLQPAGSHFTTHYRRGRFFEVQMGSDGPAQPWEISGFDVDIKRGGRR